VHVLALRIDLHIAQATSLKAKRAVVRPLVESARHRFGVSAAEVDCHDQWQRAVLGFAAVASTAGHAEELIDRVERFVWSHPGVEVVARQRGWVELAE
jgi:uncharacterized protein YlxP (DUF503 family)